MKNLHLKIKSFIFALTLFLLHVEEAKGIAINAMPLMMPQHLTRHFYFMKPEIGEKHGLLTLTEEAPVFYKGGNCKHKFICDCGNEHTARLSSVRNGSCKSCGCSRRPKIGESNGMLTVINNTPISGKNVKCKYLFKCECGEEKYLPLGDVRTGNTSSCGCMKYVTETERQDIIKDYLDGLSYNEVSKKYAISNSYAFNIINENHIGRTISEGARKYTINESCFTEITPESMYWAGFLAADGCVAKDGLYSKIVTLTLQEKDIDHVRLFADFIGSNKPVLLATQGGARISANSVKIANDLLRFGITERKSIIYTPTDICLNSVDFWRGMVDGDGGVYIDRKGNISVMLCGSYGAVSGFVDWVKTFTDSKSSVNKSVNIWRAYIFGVHAERVLQRFHENNGVSLARKKETAVNFMQLKRRKELYI